jgi:8-oxo-dGTP pyrophosphatase MutT (NUDIX family)
MQERRHRARSASPVQVAAVCFRHVGHVVEFLLVRTSSGRWTFPKGRLEDALSLPEVAALEAMEEAGAHGEVDPRPVGVYLHRKESLRGLLSKDVNVVAFLMQVSRADLPSESGRVPRWFNARETRERLGQRRSGQYRKTVEIVLDAALKRIARHRPVRIA